MLDVKTRGILAKAGVKTLYEFSVDSLYGGGDTISAQPLDVILSEGLITPHNIFGMVLTTHKAVVVCEGNEFFALRHGKVLWRVRAGQENDQQKVVLCLTMLSYVVEKLTAPKDRLKSSKREGDFTVLGQIGDSWRYKYLTGKALQSALIAGGESYAKRLHDVRAHERTLASGKVVRVRAHQRGDKTLGTSRGIIRL